MSDHRTALRLLTVAALKNGGKTPFPTLAGKYVYDSRLDPIQSFTQDERRPIVIVYTDDEDNDPITTAWSSYKARTDLLIQISVFSMKTDDVAKQTTLHITETDAVLEARLDRLERQIRTVLFRSQSHFPKYLRENFGVQFKSGNSKRYASENGSERYATRVLTLSCSYTVACLDCEPMASGPQNTTPRLAEPLHSVINAIETHATGDIRQSALNIREDALSDGLFWCFDPIILPSLTAVEGFVLPTPGQSSGAPLGVVTPPTQIF